MNTPRIRAAGLAVAASLGVSACATYPGLGYGGVSVGMGQGGYYDPYYDRYGYDRYGQRYGGYGYSPYGYGYPGYGYGYSPYGYGMGYYPWAGWHNGYYYPGTGHYVYRDGRRLQWTPAQRSHFETLRRVWQQRAREGSGDSDKAGQQTSQQSGVVKSVSGARELRRVTQQQARRQVRTQARQERSAARAEAQQERRARAIEAWRERRQSRTRSPDRTAPQEQ